MSNRTRKARVKQPPPEQPFDREKAMARFRSMSHRGTTFGVVPSGVVVEARNPEELEANTDREVVRRTKDEPEN